MCGACKQKEMFTTRLVQKFNTKTFRGAVHALVVVVRKHVHNFESNMLWPTLYRVLIGSATFDILTKLRPDLLRKLQDAFHTNPVMVIVAI